MNYKTKIKRLVCEFPSCAESLEGINLRDLSEEGKKDLVLFTEEIWPKIIVKSGKRHALVHDGCSYVGLVVSNKGLGEKDNCFKQYRVSARYVLLTNNFVVDYESIY